MRCGRTKRDAARTKHRGLCAELNGNTQMSVCSLLNHVVDSYPASEQGELHALTTDSAQCTHRTTAALR